MTSDDMATKVGASPSGAMLFAMTGVLAPTSRLYVRAALEDDPRGLRGATAGALPFIRVPLAVAGRGVLASLRADPSAERYELLKLLRGSGQTEYPLNVVHLRAALRVAGLVAPAGAAKEALVSILCEATNAACVNAMSRKDLSPRSKACAMCLDSRTDVVARGLSGGKFSVEEVCDRCFSAYGALDAAGRDGGQVLRVLHLRAARDRGVPAAPAGRAQPLPSAAAAAGSERGRPALAGDHDGGGTKPLTIACSTFALQRRSVAVSLEADDDGCKSCRTIAGRVLAARSSPSCSCFSAASCFCFAFPARPRRRQSARFDGALGAALGAAAAWGSDAMTDCSCADSLPAATPDANFQLPTPTCWSQLRRFLLNSPEKQPPRRGE